MANVLFSGSSRFANDFQSIIDRQVAFASLPVTMLQNTKISLSSQSTALSSLDSKLTSLQTATTGVENALGLGSFSSSLSNAAGTTAVSAALSAGAGAGSYTIEVTSLGSSANTMSNDGLSAVNDPAVSSLSSASTFSLTVNGVNFAIEPATGTLNSLVTAINSASGTNVQASLVNIGTSASPDYRLAVQSKLLGANSIQLNDGTQDLLSTQVVGAKATYKINGLATAIESTSRTITLSPGLTVNLLAQSPVGDATTLTVSRSTNGVSNALASFVTAYNSVVDELATSRGESAGALAGQSIISVASGALRDVATYSVDSGAILSLSTMGLNFDTKGHLSFDTSDFSTATSGQFDAMATFLGSSGSTGSGFLKLAADTLVGLEDPTTGLVKTSLQSLKAQMTRQDTVISEATERVERMKTNLLNQMAASDALIAGLEQQANYFSSMFEAMRIASQSF